MAARDPKRAVAQFVAELELAQKLLGGEFPAGYSRADHERELLEALLTFACGALVAVVLLIGAVVLEKLDARLAEEVVAVAELGGNLSAEVLALILKTSTGLFFSVATFRALVSTVLFASSAIRGKPKRVNHAGKGGMNTTTIAGTAAIVEISVARQNGSTNVYFDYYHYRHSSPVSQVLGTRWWCHKPSSGRGWSRQLGVPSASG